MSDGVIRQSVPGDWESRLKIRNAMRRYVHEKKLIPPQTLELLRAHASLCLEKLSLTDTGWEDFTVIMLNNALWEKHLSGIPQDQRLLLLPLCLRNQLRCQAPRDELGLICHQCGKCEIPNLSEQAENKGMPVLVAESSSRVVEWVENGEIQAIIGISCLDSLRKAFPAMLRHAVPGIAIPLTKDGCKDTVFDQSFLNDVLAMDNNDTAQDNIPVHIVRYDRINEHLKMVFSIGEVQKHLHATTPWLQIFPQEVYHALCVNGKHYRPMITYGSYLALTGNDDFPNFLNLIALAVECFHKASLIHDDIEDGDQTRYDEPTLHHRIGTPAAINLGDFLIGEGYRLLCHPSIPDHLQAKLLSEVAQAHCELSLGQAQEFEYTEKNITIEQCIETHRLKTAPAFRVALSMGAITAGKFDTYHDVFHQFADLFGISYQLQDDLEDASDNPVSAVDCLMRTCNIDRETARSEITAIYESYRMKTYDVLEKIDDPTLKIFMYRLIGKVLKNV